MATLQLTAEILEKFQLWREFLKRSDKYLRISTLLKERSQKHPMTDPLINSWCYALPELRKPYYDWMWSVVPYEERKALTEEDQAYGNILNFTYPLFQDVENEQQLELLKHRVKLFYELYTFTPVRKAQEDIKDTIYGILQEHDNDEVFTKSHLLDELSWGFDSKYNAGEACNIVAFDPTLPDELIISHLRKYLKTVKQRNEPTPPGPRGLFFSCRGHRLSVFEGYIRLLDRINAMKASLCTTSLNQTLEAIFKEDNPAIELQKSNCSNWKKLQRHKNKAFDLLEKAENAQFPGPYTATKNDPVLKSNEYAKVQSQIKQKRRAKRDRGLANKYPLESYFSAEHKK